MRTKHSYALGTLPPPLYYVSGALHVVPFVYDTVVARLPPHLPNKVVHGFTEYKFVVENQQQQTILRAHPSYRSLSRQQRDAWYDWALFALEAEFRPPKIDTDTREENDYSLLLEFGNVYDHFHIIPCSYIAEPTIVVPNIHMIPPGTLPQTNKGKRARQVMDELIAPLGDGFFVLTPREDWRQCFSNLIRSYNEID